MRLKLTAPVVYGRIAFVIILVRRRSLSAIRQTARVLDDEEDVLWYDILQQEDFSPSLVRLLSSVVRWCPHW